MTISVVQSSPTATFGSPVTPGNTVFLIVGDYSAPTVTVTGIELGSTVITGTTQLAYPQTAGGGSPQGVLIAMLPNVGVSGQTVVNYTCSGSVIAAAVVEVAGLGSSPSMDFTPLAATGATGTAASGTSAATTVSAEFILAAISDYNGTAATPTGSSWTYGTSNSLLNVGGHLTAGWIIQSTSGTTYSISQAVGGTVGWAVAVVSIKPTAPVITTTSLPGGVHGASYSQTVAATGVGPFTFSISAGSLPSPLTIGSSTGVISGTPTGTGTSSFTVQVIDANGLVATQALSIAVSSPVTFDTPPATPPNLQSATTFLDVQTEILLNGAWVNISPYTLSGTSSIGRGHPDESTTASPSTFTATLDNKDGRFSQTNPTSPYYPYLGLNTPIRASIPQGSAHLRSEYDQLSGASCPNTAGIRAANSGAFSVIADVDLDNWFGCAVLASQWVSAGNQRSWMLATNGTGSVILNVSQDGTIGNSYNYQPGVNLPFTHGRYSIMATFNAGTVTFYIGQYSTGWTQFGSTTVNSANTVAYASTAPVQVGYASGQTDFSGTNTPASQSSPMGYNGKAFAFCLMTGSAGSLSNAVCGADFTAQSPGSTSFTDPQGNAWTTTGTAEISSRRYRFHGYVSAWPQSWTPGAANAMVSISAGGKLRQQGQGQAPAQSAMYRFYANAAAPALAAYWPMEDPATATSFTSASGGANMPWSGSPTLASSTAFLGSQALPVLNGATFNGKVQYAGTWQANDVRMLAILAGSETPTTNLLTIFTTGTYAMLQVVYSTANGGSYVLNGYNGAGTQLNGGAALCSLSSGGTGYTGLLTCVQVAVTVSGANVTATMQVAQLGQLGVQSPNNASYTQAGSLGAVTRVEVNAPAASGRLIPTVVGHLAVLPTYNSIFNMIPLAASTGPGWPYSGTLPSCMNGWLGESAGIRFGRITVESGLQFRGIGNMADTAPMGVQPVDTAPNLLQYCADADQGMWFEPRQALGYGYRSRVSLGNQLAWVTFDYNQDHLSDDLAPTHDDQNVTNDITVINSATGSIYRATLNDGSALAMNGPAGQYANQVAMYLSSDIQLPDEAGWILNTKTVNEPRYTQINVDLANSVLSSLWYQILDAEVGDRVTVANPPVWLPPGQIDQLIQGLGEVIAIKDLQPAWNGIPTTPRNVVYLDDPIYGRCDTDGSTLATADPTGTATSLSVATTNATSPLWTTNAADFPLNIIIGGEVITVSNITGASSPQTFTVTRSVNGVVKPQTAGTDVRLAIQPTLSL